jgi:hypothetical protein
MTAETYYRRAAFLPVVVPLLAFIMLLVLTAIGGPVDDVLRATDDVAGFLVIAGLLSLVPYGLFVGIALAVGYFYAVLINLGLVAAKRLRCVTSVVGDPPTGHRDE